MRNPPDSVWPVDPAHFRFSFVSRSICGPCSSFCHYRQVGSTLAFTDGAAADGYDSRLAGDKMNPVTIKPPRCRDSEAGTPPVILLVEDEPIVREVTLQVLQRAGYHVLQSSGPEEALRVAAEHQGQIGLLLTDVIMPGMNGADLANRLQNMQPGLITVFMSGYAEHDVVRNMRRQSVIHIEKPFTVDILLSRIAEALGTEVRSLPTARLPSLSV